MKSYDNAIKSLRSQIADLKRHIKVVKKYPPERLYLLFEDMVVYPRRYIVSEDRWRNALWFNVLASDVELSENHYWVSLNTVHEKIKPLDVKNLPLYVHLKNKSPLFEKILKTGKLPKR
jgi:hypothetical protein